MPAPAPSNLPGLERLLGDPHPEPGVRCLALALGAVATSRFAAAEEAFARAFALGVPPGTVVEVAASAHLIAGFPRAINGLEACQRARRQTVSEETGRRHAKPGPAPSRFPSPPAPAGPLSATSIQGRGRALFDAIYGEGAAHVLDHLATLAPDFGDWVLEHAYGQVLSRPGAPALLRELTVAGALVVLDVPRQLRSHVRGARRLGASPADVAGTVVTMDILATPAQAALAREILAQEGITPPWPRV